MKIMISQMKAPQIKYLKYSVRNNPVLNINLEK